jgi:Sec-independent protein translocase protein TatA
MSVTDFIPGFSYVKLGLAALGLAAVAVPTTGWIITSHTLHGVREWQSTVISVTSTAAHVTNKKGNIALLAAKDVPEQIKKLGEGIDSFKAAQATAQTKHDANNARVEGAQNEITKDLGNEIHRDISVGRTVAGNYSATHRLHDPQGSSAKLQDAAGGREGSGSVDAANGADGSAGVPVLVSAADVQICTDNTIKLLAWQAGWKRVAAIPLNEEPPAVVGQQSSFGAPVVFHPLEIMRGAREQDTGLFAARSLVGIEQPELAFPNARGDKLDPSAAAGGDGVSEPERSAEREHGGNALSRPGADILDHDQVGSVHF